MDPNPYQLNAIEKNVRGPRKGDQSFKVFIHTLAQFSILGPGSYGMSTLKRMTGTESFKQLPVHQKKCLVHNREECQTQKYLDQVQGECYCSLWALGTYHQVKPNSMACFPIFAGVHLLWPREGELCWKPNLEGQKLFGSLYWSLR